ncbi:glycosyltransferase family 87 protein [Parabacteroides pacaensis]|uniref:glycosyltransferase family 87 protein n=1 Tax=Parabacteroides pacaensis TaxID=2086575 RepID=UPI000D0FB172|nr:glycosyltransferase family 87 protein [Parabacteroides pacaensis]
MDKMNRIRTFFSNPFFSNYHTLLGLWILLAIIAWVTKYFHDSYNNFLIFKYTFWHVIEKLPMFVPYPNEYMDVNHYGPVFSLVIAPFALSPLWLGLFLWLTVLSLFLYYAIRELPLLQKQRIFIYWFCAHELLTALFMSQFNIAIAAIIVLSYAFIEKEKEPYAAFLIMLGTFVKLYGIVGLAFFFFSRHKKKFVFYCIAWAAVLFVAPMLISGPEYVLSQYQEWFERLQVKNQLNMFADKQNISLLGMVRKISGSSSYSDLWLIIPGLIAFAIPYLRIKQYKYPAFRKTLLASTLMFVVLFSTGSESSTYIIPFIGVAIWYVVAPWKRSKLDIGLMIFAFILTSMSPSDLFPKYLKVHYVFPYALKAFPCVLIWLKLCFEMYTRDYRLEK